MGDFKKHRKVKNSVLIFGLIGLLIISFNNCSPVRFEQIETPQIVAPEVTPQLGSAVIVEATKNYVDLMPNTKLVDGNTINIVMFVDASGSMAGIKDSFKATLEQMIDKFKNSNLQLAIYNPNGLTKSTNVIYKLDSNGQRIIYKDMSSVPIGEYFQERNDSFDYGSVFNKDTDLASVTSISASIFQFGGGVSQGNENTKAAALMKLDKMLNSTAFNSSALDTPFCGMYRAIEDMKSGLSPFTQDPNSPTVFMVLSNEDDESIIGNSDQIINSFPAGTAANLCVKSITEKREINQKRIINYFHAMYPEIVISTAEVIVDGAKQTKTNMTLGSLTSIFIPYSEVQSKELTEGQDCLTTYGADLASIKSRINSAGNNGNFFTATDVFTVASCKIKKHNYYLVKLQFADAETYANPPNNCLALENSVTTSFPKAIPGTCWQSLETGSSSGFLSYQDIIPLGKSENIIAAAGDRALLIKKSLEEYPNSKNIYYTSVINPIDNSCTLTDGARIGTTYQKLSTLLETNANLIPICSANYGDQILSMAEKMKTLAVSDFTIPPDVDFEIGEVQIIVGDQIQIATPEVDYQIVDGRIVFTKNLNITDIVRINKKIGDLISE